MRNGKKDTPLSVLDGGLAVFRGVELVGGKPITGVVRTKHSGVDTDSISGTYLENTVIITYSDGCEYKAVCERLENDDLISLRNFEEYWNGVLI